MKALAVGLWFIDFPFVSVITVPTLSLLCPSYPTQICKNHWHAVSQPKRTAIRISLHGSPTSRAWCFGLWSFIVFWGLESEIDRSGILADWKFLRFWFWFWELEVDLRFRSLGHFVSASNCKSHFCLTSLLTYTTQIPYVILRFERFLRPLTSQCVEIVSYPSCRSP